MKNLAIFAFIAIITNIFSQSLQCIPHHIGESNWPANTVYALKHSIKKFPFNNTTLVLSLDGYPIAFHGFNLAKTTNGNGDPESYTLKYLKNLDAGYTFHPEDKYPLRNKGIKIPTLKELLLTLPKSSEYRLILDLKSHHNQQLVKQIISVINSLDNPKSYWGKLIFYSTDNEILTELKNLEPMAQMFLTRQKTLEILLNDQITEQQKMDIKNIGWIGFEMERRLCEQFTLGENCAQAKKLWTNDKIKELRKINPDLQVVVFAADSLEDQLKSESAQANYIYVNAPNDYKTCSQ